MTRHVFLVAVGIWALLAVPLLLIAAEGGSETAPPSPSRESTAPQLVQAALDCDLRGDNRGRAALLQQAVQKDPDLAAAHWHLGETLLGDQWLPLGQAQERMRGDAKLSEYRRLREHASAGAADQAALARWCKKNKLTSEEQTHWRMVLQSDPTNQEATKGLGRQKYHGVSLTPPQIAQANQRTRAALQAAEKFEPLVAKWRRAIEDNDTALRGEVVEKVRAIYETAEMTGLERAVAQQRGTQKERQRSYRAISAELVTLLSDMPQQAAADSLARHAVLSPFADIRAAAAVALKKRPWDSYVPLLLSGMATPLEASVRLGTTAEGRIQRYYDFFREGTYADLSISWMTGVSYTGSPQLFDQFPDERTRTKALAQAAVDRRKALIADQARTMRETASVKQAVEQTNQAIAGRNARIQEALKAATGIDKGDDPIAWWRWWAEDYNGYESPNNPYDDTDQGEKRRYELTYDSRSLTQHQVYRGPSSCFPRGTPVSALTGLMAIEDVRVGDRVLAQHPDTGELAFKPVLGVTTRAPGPRIKIRAEDQSIVATPGHPFWVVGQGWRMAKQLTTGMRLHGLSGSLEITSLEDVAAPLPYHEVAYNLIVADFSSYFVGDVPLLVHDNTPRRAATTPLPGLNRPLALNSPP